MENIDYNWDESTDKTNPIEEKIEVKEESGNENLSTRHNMQIARRLFHMFNGGAIATLYLVSFNHSQMIHFLGTIACVLYVVEQVRISYPETASKLLPFTRFIMRAEEQLKESAMVPYAMAVLLTIVAFPKHIALVGIYSLAIADPLSAIIGIRFGKHKLTPTRSIEGSLAFFLSITIVSLIILTGFNGKFDLLILFVSSLLGILATGFDMIPLKLDDNLTIPLFTSAALWTICTLFGVYI
jgi:diacylglycerol kinase (CTP)